MAGDGTDLYGAFFERLDAPAGPRAKALHAYWRALAPPPNLPWRRQIAMDDLARLDCLDSIFILEPLEDGSDWRYRLLGTRIVEIYGQEVTNVPLREHMTSEEAEQAIALSNAVRDSREPLFLRARFVSGDYDTPIETMSLPILGRDADDVWLFGGTFFTSR
ncbi:PAS domain-containing protein [Marivibrio halodurans]|uniref:PAS domain-containing protein n=1 Tax=Marivibrio halodurans TaxID=2039722 RepID=A0A8J7V0V5_9PROT|nr:PAS domain-containing protein [Marivibrio halodurans]MBP5855446.1 PAS domain-containing protein [Marivibrio halodurans]